MSDIRRLDHVGITVADLDTRQQQAAIAAVHDDAASAEETDCPQILVWDDYLIGQAAHARAASRRKVVSPSRLRPDGGAPRHHS
jgi:predicted RNA polymerase sigma factor